MKTVKKNLIIERGDAYLGEDRLEIRVPGDWSTHKCSMGVKLDKLTPSSNLLIRKRNTLYNGSDDELEAIYDGSDTCFKISIQKEDTGDFLEPKYYWDLIAIDPSNGAKTKTLAKGEFKVEFDTQTEFDNTQLPTDAVRYFPVILSDIGAGKVVKINATEDDVEGVDVYTEGEADILLSGKVDKVTGKGLSTEDYSTNEKNKLSGIEAGAEVNNISDVNATHLTDGGVTTLHKHSYNNLDNLPDLTLKADLVEGKVPSTQLPSYVDDVVEVANYAALPVPGETGKIYVTLDDNKTYRWSGSGYVVISASLALGETSSTAYRGDRGKTAYDHSQVTHDKALVGLGNVDNTSDSTKNSATATLTNKTLSAPIITGATNITDAIFNRAVHSKGDEGGYRLDGVDDLVTIPDNDNLDFGIGDFSIVLNIRTGSDITSQQRVISKSFTNGYAVSILSGKLFVAIGGTTNLLSYDIQANKLYHIVVVRSDTNQASVYINGAVAVAGSVDGGSITNGDILAFGRRNTSAVDYFRGTIYSSQLFNRALTQSEVLAYYNNGSPTEYSMPYADRGASNTNLIGALNFASGWSLNSGVSVDNASQYTSTGNGGVYRNIGITTSNFFKIFRIRLAGTTTATSIKLGRINSSAFYYIEGLTGSFDTTFTFVGNGLSYGMALENVGAGTTNITTFEVITIGNVLDLQPQWAGQFGWIDNSGNRLHGQTSGSPIALAVGVNANYKDIKTAITGNTTLTNVIPKEYRIRGILVNNTTANAVTISIGTSSGGTQVVNAKACGAGLTFINDAEILAKIFSLTADQTLFVHSANWNSSSINVEFSLSKY
ncbi:MAG: LamG domain-containing protein [Melioribacteraceae bacterium]|nr:LamG domain-containing protein [Melioribacteraceae bacterium]